MIAADQLLAHAVGDYLLQSDWMANRKVRSSVAAGAHTLTYALPFLLLTRSPAALAVIVSTHFLIDRFRLARYVVWAKNFLAPPGTGEWVKVPNNAEVASLDGHVNQYRLTSWWHPWAQCRDTGYHQDRPVWLRVWLLIIADNVLHVSINGAALRWL